MFQRSAPRLWNVNCGLIMALSLSAAAGWASFALSRHSSAEMERQLRAQVADLQATGSQLLAERTKTQVSLSEMVKLRGELAMARSEVNRLSQARDQTLADLSPVRPNAKGASLRPNNANDDVSRTGSIGEKTRPKKDKAVSAKLSEKLPRNQQIAAVGIAAPSGQKPVEKPQRSKEPTVISELDTAALRQLTKLAEASLR
jgi:DNA-directed RNA polymerase beta subunit